MPAFKEKESYSLPSEVRRTCNHPMKASRYLSVCTVQACSITRIYMYIHVYVFLMPCIVRRPVCKKILIQLLVLEYTSCHEKAQQASTKHDTLTHHCIHKVGLTHKVQSNGKVVTIFQGKKAELSTTSSLILSRYSISNSLGHQASSVARE